MVWNKKEKRKKIHRRRKKQTIIIWSKKHFVPHIIRTFRWNLYLGHASFLKYTLFFSSSVFLPLSIYVVWQYSICQNLGPPSGIVLQLTQEFYLLKNFPRKLTPYTFTTGEIKVIRIMTKEKILYFIVIWYWLNVFSSFSWVLSKHYDIHTVSYEFYTQK